MTKLSALVLCSAFLLSSCTPSAQEPDSTAESAQTDHAHDESAVHQDGSTADLPAHPSQLWSTDAPLRQGMGAIAQAVATAEGSRAAGRFGKAEATLLTDSIQKQFQFMAANCKLEPQADAALHSLVAQLLEASSALKEDPTGAANFGKLRHVLSEYPHYFDHQGWQLPEPGHNP